MSSGNIVNYLLRNLLKKKIKFIFFGAINTLFGYINSIFIYYLLVDVFNIVFIGIFINLINITFSFCTYKFFVFKSKKNFFTEYFKALIVYLNLMVLSTFLLWLFVDFFKIFFELASLITILIIMVISFFSHEKFTFK